MSYINDMFTALDWKMSEWVLFGVGMLIGTVLASYFRYLRSSFSIKKDSKENKARKNEDTSKAIVQALKDEGLVVSYVIHILPIIIGIIASVIGALLSDGISLETARQRALAAIDDIEALLGPSRALERFREEIRKASSKEEIVQIMSEVRQFVRSMS